VSLGGMRPCGLLQVVEAIGLLMSDGLVLCNEPNDVCFARTALR